MAVREEAGAHWGSAGTKSGCQGLWQVCLEGLGWDSSQKAKKSTLLLSVRFTILLNGSTGFKEIIKQKELNSVLKAVLKAAGSGKAMSELSR